MAHILLLFLLAMPVEEPCSPACTGTTWELRMLPQDEVVASDLSQWQCEALKKELTEQTPQWMELKCIEINIKREKA